LNEWGVKSWQQYLEDADDTYLMQFEFSRFVSFLLDSFENERLFIYDHQELVDNFGLFSNRLNSFLEIPSTVIEKASAGKKENVSIPVNLEKTLVFLNRLSFTLHKYIGFRLALKLGKLRVNPVIICKKLIFFTKKPKTKRNLNDLRIRFNKDWQHTQQLIKSI
jgi:hypothetical protein